MPPPLQVQSKLPLPGRGFHGERRRLLRPDAGPAAEPRQLLPGHPQLCDADGLFRRQRLRPGTGRRQARGGGGTTMTSWQSLTSVASVRYQQVLTNDSCTKCRPGSRWRSRPTSTGSPGPPGQGEGTSCLLVSLVPPPHSETNILSSLWLLTVSLGTRLWASGLVTQTKQTSRVPACHTRALTSPQATTSGWSSCLTSRVQRSLWVWFTALLFLPSHSVRGLHLTSSSSRGIQQWQTVWWFKSRFGRVCLCVLGRDAKLVWTKVGWWLPGADWLLCFCRSAPGQLWLHV